MVCIEFQSEKLHRSFNLNKTAATVHILCAYARCDVVEKYFYRMCDVCTLMSETEKNAKMWCIIFQVSW